LQVQLSQLRLLPGTLRRAVQTDSHRVLPASSVCRFSAPRNWDSPFKTSEAVPFIALQCNGIAPRRKGANLQIAWRLRVFARDNSILQHLRFLLIGPELEIVGIDGWFGLLFAA
jgi:hypothetical protein